MNKDQKNSSTFFNEQAKYLKTDIIFYKGPINEEGMQMVFLKASNPNNKNILFILSTFGGDPDCAFKIMRELQNRYKHITLALYDFCKSAGTLMALGSDKIIMNDRAEFGPLDMQINGESALDVIQSITFISRFSIAAMLDAYEGFLQKGIAKSLALKSSIDFAKDLYSPITSKIDPLILGHHERINHIAYAYGIRLSNHNRGNLTSLKRLQDLIFSYPSHGLVIDFHEAQSIFKNIELLNKEIGTLIDMIVATYKVDEKALFVERF